MENSETEISSEGYETHSCVHHGEFTRESHLTEEKHSPHIGSKTKTEMNNWVVSFDRLFDSKCNLPNSTNQHKGLFLFFFYKLSYMLCSN